MKKRIALLLAVVMLLSMTACGGSAEPVETALATTEPATQVTEAPTEAPTEEPTATPTEVPTEPKPVDPATLPEPIPFWRLPDSAFSRIKKRWICFGW